MGLFGRKKKKLAAERLLEQERLEQLEKEAEELVVLEEQTLRLEAISLASKLDKILEVVEITEDINEGLVTLRSAVINFSKDFLNVNKEVINKVTSLLDDIITKPVSFNANSKMIIDLEKLYLIDKEVFNESVLNDLDIVRNTHIKVDESALKIFKLQKDMDEITKRIVDENIKTTDHLYTHYTNKYQALKQDFEEELYVYDTNQGLIRTNKSVSSLKRRDHEITLAKERSLMDFEDVLRLAARAKLKDEDFKDNLEAINQVLEDYKPDNSLKTDTSVLEKEVEWYLINEVLNNDDETFIKDVTSSNEELIFNKLEELINKIDTLEQQQKDFDLEDSLINKNYTLINRIYNDGILDKQNPTNLDLQINNLLNSDPKNLQGASLLIRSTIENYCRFKGGINLSDTFRFKAGTRVEEKFRVAGINEDHLADLVKIHRDTNSYIHNDIVEIGRKTEEQRVNEIVSAIELIKKLGVDRFDTLKAIENVYLKQESFIKEQALKVNDIEAFKNLRNVDYAIDYQIKAANYLKKEGVIINSSFKDALSKYQYLEEVEKYINEHK